MKRKLLFLSVLHLFCAASVFATDVPAGNVSGKWTKANSPYKIKGDLTVGASDKLEIEPGVEVIADGLYKINVLGVFVAVGTATDTIRFTASNTSTGWGGVRFDNSKSGANGAMSGNDSSFISYCRFQNGIVKTSWPDNSGGAIFASDFEQIKISNCLFIDNESAKGGAIYAQYGGVIENCTFVNNKCDGKGSGGAVYLKTLGSITNCNFINNEAYYGGAVLLTASGGTADGFATMRNCKMYNNKATQGGAVRSYKGTMINCVVANNSADEGAGIRVEQTKVINCTVTNNKGISGNYILKENTVVNTILWRNNASTDQNQITTSDTAMVVKYCAIEGGYTGQGAQAGIVILSANNNDVKFKKPTTFDGASTTGMQMSEILNADWRIEKGSSCVDAGENFSFPPQYSGDINGAARVYNNKIDIGAYEYAPDTSINVANVQALEGVKVYPTVTSDYAIVENNTGHTVYVNIYSISGALLTSSTVTGDRQKVDVSAFPSGILYIQLYSDKTSSVFKVIRQ